MKFVVEIDGEGAEKDSEFAKLVIQENLRHHFPQGWTLSVRPYRPGADVLRAWDKLKIARGYHETGDHREEWL